MKVDVHSRQFLTVLRAVMRFASKPEDCRPHLSAVLFETGKDVIEMVATNGHALIQAHFPAPGMTPQPGLDASIQLSTCARLVSVLASAAKNATATIDLGVLTVECDGVTVHMRRESEAFPPYKKVLGEDRSGPRADKIHIAARYVKLLGETFHGGIAMSPAGEIQPTVHTGVICPARREHKKTVFGSRSVGVYPEVTAVAVVMPWGG